MINAIVGRPRAGKSYESVVFHIIPNAVDGRKVVTNIPVNLEKIALFFGQDAADNITVVKANFNEYGMIRPFSIPEDFTQYEWKNEKGQGVLFVVDECHLSVGIDAKKPVLEYLSLHGHYGHDIIVVTQSPKKLHRDLKDMIEVQWRCVKKSVFGDDTKYIKKTYHGVSLRNDDFVHEEEREYKKEYFPFYQSHTQSSSPVDEAKANDIKANAKPFRKASIAMVVFGVLLSLWFGKQMISPSEKEVKQIDKVTSSSVIDNQTASTGQASSPIRVATKAKRVEKKEVEKVLPEHPFYKVNLHVDSSAEFTLNGYLIKEIYFAASQNGQVVFVIKTTDLRLAGYDVQILGDCLVKVHFDNYNDYITCDSPTVGVNPNETINTPEST